MNIATDFDQSYMNRNINIQSDASQENIKRSRATKIIKELSEISLRNPLEIQQDNEMFQQSIGIYQLNQLMQQNLMHSSIQVPGQLNKSSIISQSGLPMNSSSIL